MVVVVGGWSVSDRGVSELVVVGSSSSSSGSGAL